MASVKISALTSAGTLAGTETLPVVQSGTTKKATAQQIADLVLVAVSAGYQPLDSDLTAFAGLAIAADKLPYGTGSHTLGLADLTAAGRALIDDADAAAQRTTLGLVIGTNVQAYDADLAALAAITGVQGDVLYYNGSAWARLGAGTSGQVLTTAGAGANPSWAAAGGGTGKQTIPVMAVAMSPRQSAGCANIAWIVGASGQPDIPYLAFDPSTIEYAEFALEMPKSWDESTITFEPIWTHPATATNFGTVWKLEAVAVADSATMLASFGTGQTSTDTGGNTSYRYNGPESAAITVGGSPTASNTVFCRLSRVATDGSDTLAVDAYLTGIRIYYTTDASNDA